jgi:hypothetical protein
VPHPFHRAKKSLEERKELKASAGDAGALTLDTSDVKPERRRSKSPIARVFHRLRRSSSVASFGGVKDNASRTSNDVSSATFRDSEELQESVIRDPSIVGIADWAAGFNVYNQLVTTYTDRNLFQTPETVETLSYFADRLEILSEQCGGHLCNGLPEAALDLALLWAPAGQLARNDDSPTWSWAGWLGQVNFPFDPTSCPDLLGSNSKLWFKSEIREFHLGSAAPHIVRRSQDPKLRIGYPEYNEPLPDASDEVDPNAGTLQFWTQTISATGYMVEQLKRSSGPIPCSHLINAKGKHCGVIMEFETALPNLSNGDKYEFALLSRNITPEPISTMKRPRIPTYHPPGTPIWEKKRFLWTEDVVEHDPREYKAGPWAMLNVLLIKWEGGKAERVGVARIHEDAWIADSPRRTFVVLD